MNINDVKKIIKSNNLGYLTEAIQIKKINSDNKEI